MRKRLIALLSIVMCLMFVLSACDYSEGPVTQTITTVLTKCNNNDDVRIEGVVYGVVSNGFYVSDTAEGRIFVMGGENINSGDRVIVEGKFALVNNMPQVQNATVTVTENNQPVNTFSTYGTIAQINELDATVRTGSYGAYYTIVANLSKDESGNITLVDDDGNALILNSQSNQSALESFIGQRVRLSVIAHSYSDADAVWKVSFTETEKDCHPTDEGVVPPLAGGLPLDQEIIQTSLKDIAKDKKLYLTSIGQSDIDVARNLLSAAGLKETTQEEAGDYETKDLLAASEVEQGSVVFVVVGASTKGLGGAGTDITKETTRANEFATAASEGKLTIISLHLGKQARRGDLSDGIIEIVEKASSVMLISDDGEGTGGNYDGFMGDISKENNIPAYCYSKATGMVDPLKYLLGL